MSSSNLATASAKEVLEYDERLILKDNEGKKGNYARLIACVQSCNTSANYK